MNNKFKNAFTLIELLVVIAIIGILSGLIIVGMSSSVDSARIAKAQIFSASMRDSLLMNLVSEWKLDQVNSNITPDSWSSNNCTLSGATLPQLRTAGCIYSNCLSFNGTTAYLDCGNTSTLDITGNITVSAWVNTTNTAREFVVSRLVTTPTTNGYYLDISGATQGMTRFVTYNNAASGTSTTAISVIDGKWHYLVGTYNGSNNFLYIDGVKQTSGAGLNPGSNTSIFRIGIAFDGVSNRFNGSIDDVRIYNNTLPTSTIKNNYYTGINNLLAKNDITIGEYRERLFQLNNNLAKN